MDCCHYPTGNRVRVTREEYLARERVAETKSEYYGGEVVAMAGASREHNVILLDLTVALGTQLRGGSCQPFPADMRVHVPACDRYYYPDLSVACGDPDIETLEGVDSLRNPTLIVEVMSDSTERRDRGEKWTCYQTLPSLQTYVLISQHRPLVEVYERNGVAWVYTAYIGLDTAIPLESIGCAAKLADIYARVPFPDSSAKPGAAPTT